jgi:hypothetical protein
MAGKAKNLLGKRFGRWTVINRQQNKKTRAAWLVVCDCGNQIGRAISFKSRLNSIQSSNVEILKVVATMPGGLAEERSLHARFQSTRIRGEWFGPSPELLELIEANRWNGRRHAA